MEEAARSKGEASPQRPLPRAKEVPCNFSPALGTQSSVQKLQDPILLGLRNQTHWQGVLAVSSSSVLLERNSNRKYGKLPGR